MFFSFILAPMPRLFFFFFLNQTNLLQVRDAAQRHLNWVRNKNYLLSLAVQAMCVGRVNVLNRGNQGRFRNFKDYTKGLDTTIADLHAIRNADAVSNWLRYRISQPGTGLSKYFTLTDADYAVCAKRTATFVDALSSTLEENMPRAKILEDFDIFDDSSPSTLEKCIIALDNLYDTFLKVCENSLFGCEMYLILREFMMLFIIVDFISFSLCAYRRGSQTSPRKLFAAST
jgi:hypothetical protein